MKKEINETKTNEQELDKEVEKSIDVKSNDAIADIVKERQKIAEKINGQAVSDAFITIIQRAEMHSILQKKDYYIATVENGIGYFAEEDYEKLVEKTLLDLRKYLAQTDLTEEQIENEVDSYAANLVIHYIDYKAFTEEEKQSVKDRFGITKEEK